MRYQSSYEKTAHIYDFFSEQASIDFFCRYATQFGRVLDIGSGTGRIAVPIADTGVTVYCIEPSPAMRREFTRRLSGQKELANRIMLIGGEASSFAFKRTFPFAFMSGVFDHFVDDQSRLQALMNIKDHLEDRGTFVFDVSVKKPGDSPLKAAGNHVIGKIEYARFVSSRMVTPDVREVRIVFEVREDGHCVARIEEKGLVGVMSRSKVMDLLATAGFIVNNEYGRFDFTPYHEEDELLMIEAQNAISG